MRIIAGTARGVPLKTPEGIGTRPTTERVKEALFSAIQFELAGKHVLDLFAGSGQLGLEALSRGAEDAVFVDADAHVVKLIEGNVKKTGFAQKANVFRGEALSFLRTCHQKFNLIFLDPPYQTELLEDSMKAIIEFDILSPNGIIVAEYPKGKSIDSFGLIPSREYGFGQASVTVFRKESE